MKNKNTLMIVAVVLIIVAAAGGFFVGMQYEKSQARNSAFGQFAQRFGNGNGTYLQRTGANGQQGQRFTPVRGQVLSLGSGTMTVKMQDGSTKIVVLGSNTTFVKTQTGALSDLKQGDNVMVVGTNNSDGSVTATDVQINPQGLLRPSGAPQTNQ